MSRFYKSGQITLLVLLLGMLGLTVGLSAVSRSVQDVKQTSQTDQGSQALAGAEAALQYGVAKYVSGGVYTDCPGVSYTPIVESVGFPGFSTLLQYKICKDGPAKNYGEYLGLLKDEVFQVNLPPNYNGSGGFDVYWQSPASIEVSAVTKDASGNYLLARYAYNSTASGNNFSSGSLGTPSCGPAGTYNYHSGTLVFAAPTNPGPVLIRVRALYGSTNIGICPVGTSASFAQDSLVVQGKATTTGNTTRRVQASIVPTALPAIFDYAIFAEGSLTK
jgi:hypothetical protein